MGQAGGDDLIAQAAHALFNRSPVGLLRVELHAHLLRGVVDVHRQHALQPADAVLDDLDAVGAVHAGDRQQIVVIAVDDFGASALGQALNVREREGGGIVMHAQRGRMLLTLHVSAVEASLIFQCRFQPAQAGIVLGFNAGQQ